MINHEIHETHESAQKLFVYFVYFVVNNDVYFVVNSGEDIERAGGCSHAPYGRRTRL